MQYMKDTTSKRSPRKRPAPVVEIQRLYDVIQEAITLIGPVLESMKKDSAELSEEFDGGAMGGSLADGVANFAGGLASAHLRRDRKPRLKIRSPRTKD